MLQRTRLLAVLLFWSSTATVSFAAQPPTEFAFFHENVLGTSLELRVRAEQPRGRPGGRRASAR